MTPVPPLQDAPSPLRVAVWAPVPPPTGGIGRWTLRYQAAAPRHGMDVRVVNISPPGTGLSERSGFRLDRSLRALTCLADLAQVLRQHRPAVCHITTSLFWATPRDAAAVALCRAFGVPTVVNIRASNQIIAWRNGLRPPLRHGLDAMLRGASRVLVLSTELVAYLQAELPGLAVHRIGNMVELGAPAGPVLLPPRRARIRVLFVGLRSPLKGVAELAEAVLGLPDVELALVGDTGGAIDTTQAGRMQQHLAALRATGRLLEVGAVPPEDVERVYREADVFALPSYREGLPNALLEAMAAALPCVVTPVGAIPDVVGADRALVVPVADALALREALRQLAADADLRDALGQRARAHVAAHYGIDAIMAQYRNLYLDIRAKTPARSRQGNGTVMAAGE